MHSVFSVSYLSMCIPLITLQFPVPIINGLRGIPYKMLYKCFHIGKEGGRRIS